MFLLLFDRTELKRDIERRERRKTCSNFEVVETTASVHEVLALTAVERNELSCELLMLSVGSLLTFRSPADQYNVFSESLWSDVRAVLAGTNQAKRNLGSLFKSLNSSEK